VRQALAMAINKPAIINAVFQGTGTAAKNLLPPGVWSADSELQDYAYDPQKAKALLKEAGCQRAPPLICGRCRFSDPITRMPNAWPR
jgi:ABC-type transport system substrate-binding protein